MLDVRMLKDMPRGTRFATGEMLDNEDGLFMANTGKMLRWIAIRGHGPLDWAIYCHFATWTVDEIASHGDKVSGQVNARRAVPCDDAALAEYRR